MAFVRLKICGITALRDAVQITELGVPFLGFNFYPASKRYIAPEHARRIIKNLPAVVHTVGILVRPTLEECLLTVKATGVKWLQIYDPQDFDDFTKLPVPVIAAYRLKKGECFEYRDKGEQYVLLDAFHPDEFGGTGSSLDWDGLTSSVPRAKLALAGGITPGNIEQALEIVGPAIIDVATGSEHSPGRKDLQKTLALQKAVMRYNLRQLSSKY